MSEAAEAQSPGKLPLDDIHREPITVREGRSAPASAGDVLFEYAAVREAGVGLIDLSSRGRIVVSGSEAVQFLNGLITNDMKTLAESHWMPAAFPNVQGRLLAGVRVIHESAAQPGGASAYLIDTEAATHAQVHKTVARFTLAGDFQVTDLTEQTALVSLQGTKAAGIIRSVFGEAAASVERLAVASVRWQERILNIIRATHSAEDGFDLFIEAAAATQLWAALLQAGARPIGPEAQEILRIEAGLPRYGTDMDETNVVPETSLDDAVSYTKGCYIGQEIIARIKYRGHVAKRLSGLILDRPVKVERGAKITSPEGKEIGQITSATFSPALGRTIALGYVKYDYLAAGTEIKVTAGDSDYPAQVAELPFVRGSWYL